MKFRAMLVALALGGLCYIVGVRADEPPKSNVDAAKVKEQVTLEEQKLRGQFDDFMQAMLKLKQRLERSEKAEDRDKAKILERAIEQAQKDSISTKFDSLVSFLKTEQFSNVADVQKAKDQAVDLARNLKNLLDTLREDSRANKLREERERLEKIIRELEKVIREQKIMQTRTEMPRSDPKSLQRDQNVVTKATQKIAQDLAKMGIGGEAKDTKGDAKDGKGSEKSGQGKDAGKSNEVKKAQGKEAGKGDGSKQADAKGNPSAQSGEGRQSEAKSGQGKDGGAKGSKSGSESKAGGTKDNQGQQGGQAKDSGNDKKEPGVREKTKAEAKGDQGKEASNAGKQAEAKKGSDSAGAKSSPSGSQSKSGDSKSGGGQSKQGEAKSGQSSSGQSSSKSSGEQQAGASKNDPNQKQQDQPQGPDIGRRQVEEGNYHQRQSEDNLTKKETKPASDDMGKAIDKLEEARKKLEKLLQQTREEELERLLAALQARCERMLAMQIAVLHGTQDLDRAIQKNSDKQPTHENKQRGVRLSDDEKEIVIEADKAIQMLEAEGSAVAFPEVFQQVREDMRHVQRRLYVTDAAVVTQAIEQDIIDTLKEMIEALKKARQELDNKKSPPPKGQAPPMDQKLLDMIAELKMIRAMQMRVNTRTKTYGVQYQGEQAAEPRIRQELRNLSDRQVRIFEVTNKIAKGDNR